MILFAHSQLCEIIFIDFARDVGGEPAITGSPLWPAGSGSHPLEGVEAVIGLALIAYHVCRGSFSILVADEGDERAPSEVIAARVSALNEKGKYSVCVGESLPVATNHIALLSIIGRHLGHSRLFIRAFFNVHATITRTDSQVVSYSNLSTINRLFCHDFWITSEVKTSPISKGKITALVRYARTPTRMVCVPNNFIIAVVSRHIHQRRNSAQVSYRTVEVDGETGWVSTIEGGFLSRIQGIVELQLVVLDLNACIRREAAHSFVNSTFQLACHRAIA